MFNNRNFFTPVTRDTQCDNPPESGKIDVIEVD